MLVTPGMALVEALPLMGRSCRDGFLPFDMTTKHPANLNRFRIRGSTHWTHKQPLSLICIYYCYIKFCSSRHFAFLRKCAFGATKTQLSKLVLCFFQNKSSNFNNLVSDLMRDSIKMPNFPMYTMKMMGCMMKIIRNS